MEQLDQAGTDRREFLSKYGKAALVAPPAITMLLSTSMSSPAIAQSTGGLTRGNNGVGNGDDPQPPGNPPMNDGPDSGPGNPGNGHGHNHGSNHVVTHGSHGRRN
jgi:hypothetical protein